MPNGEEILSEEQEAVERTLPKCQMPYSEIRLFEETWDILLINKKNYKISISVNLMANKMRPESSALHTSVGPNFIRKDFLQTEWLKSIQAINKTALNNAINQKVRVVGKIIHVRIGDHRVRVALRAVPILAEPFLSGTSVIDRFVKGIFAPKQKSPLHFQTVTGTCR